MGLLSPPEQQRNPMSLAELDAGFPWPAAQRSWSTSFFPTLPRHVESAVVPLPQSLLRHSRTRPSISFTPNPLSHVPRAPVRKWPASLQALASYELPHANVV